MPTQTKESPMRTEPQKTSEAKQAAEKNVKIPTSLLDQNE